MTNKQCSEIFFFFESVRKRGWHTCSEKPIVSIYRTWMKYHRHWQLLEFYWEEKCMAVRWSGIQYIYNMQIYMFVWGFSSHLRNFHTYWNVTITGEVLQIWTYTRHSWPLSIEGYSVCHNYWDAGHPFIHLYCRVVGVGTVTTCFYDLGLPRL